ncbi:ATP-dependent zinc metalloprotease FtsH [Dethiothermospora halolimnae]|uniref:ATP-dependent zinc metalloprotease FtsH n=1 Tax=Dethiothermospora halolimnae TaxID=3114390 RepID=UPI003CCC2C7E
MKINNKKKIIILLLVFIVITSLISYTLLSDNKEYKQLSYNSFIDKMNEGDIEEVFLRDDAKITGVFKDGKHFITDNPRTKNLKETLLKNGIKVSEVQGKTTVKDIITFVLILGGFAFVGFTFNKNSARHAEKEITEMSNIDNNGENPDAINFNDVAGNDEAKDSMKELVDFIKTPEKYERYGARMPRGVLLYGPPGTGKTLLAKALAGEAGVPYYAVTGSDFIQVYAGLGASRIRKLFKKARQSGKCVIFIDEIDALGKKRRGGLSGSSDESDRTLNALLTEMSGFNGGEGIIVIAATNRIDTLDEALLRPGRFDRQIEVGLPDVKARQKILKLHSRNKPVSEDVDFNKVAYQTVYFSGAKLESLMNESAMIAAKENRENINMEHIDKAFYTVIAGEEKKDRSTISNNDRKITAYHEGGHALVTKLVSPDNKVTKVTIIPSTKGAGGFSMNIPPDRMYNTKKDIRNQVMIALAGRAAEEIVFGNDNITTGASNDLQKSTDMIMSMISRFGMDEKSGLISYESILGNNAGSNSYIVDRIKAITEELYLETKEILQNNMELLDNVAKSLLEKETIDEDDLNNIIRKNR